MECDIMNFVLSEMSFLKYFMPLIIEGNKRNIKSHFYIFEHNKYTSPFKQKNISYLKDLCATHNVDIHTIKELKNSNDITFFVEGSGLEYANEIQKKISLIYGTDFVSLYDRYINKVDNVIFPSRFFAEHYNKISDKNLYLGCPKFDIVLDQLEILKKYNIPDIHNVLILFPRLRDANVVNLYHMSKLLSCLNLRKLVKTRGKDPINKQTCSSDVLRKELCGNLYFEDESWYPHTTLELMAISKLVINFDSAAIKECIYMLTPLINFHVKDRRVMDFLYRYSFCKEIDVSKPIDGDSFLKDVCNMSNSNHTSEFNLAMNNHLMSTTNICKNILDVVL